MDNIRLNKLYISVGLLVAGCLQLAGLTACMEFDAAPPTASFEPVSLPPTWTTEPISPTAVPLSPTPTPLPSPTPSPIGYLVSSFLIEIDNPEGWHSPEHLIELSDGTIMGVGPIFSNQNEYESWRETTIWIARLKPAGEIIWTRYFLVPEDDKFSPHSIHTGANNSGVLSGSYSHRTADGRNKTYPVTFSISSEGNVEWIKPFASGIKEILTGESFLLLTGIKSAMIINQQAEIISQIELDFGPDFGEVMEFPFPDLEIARQLPDGDWIFAGTINDVYWGQSSPDRSGYSEGDTAYWYARFTADGSLLWKHLFPIDPLRQRIKAMLITTDNEIVIAGTDQFLSQSYAWIRKIDTEGKTIFHKRYLDLSILSNSLTLGVDGSIYLWDRSSIPQGEYQPDLIISSLGKILPDGQLDWIRTFPSHVTINAVLPLLDGGILLSLRVPTLGITLARIDNSGKLPACEKLPLQIFESRTDIQPPLFDTADQVPLSLSFPASEAEVVIDLPPLHLKSIDLPLTELCRDLNRQ